MSEKSMEDVIRERHELEDRIRVFIAQLTTYRENALFLELRTLEIAIARAYDQMRGAKDDGERLDRMLKGHLLKSVYDAKRAGAKHSFMRKMQGKDDYFEYYEDKNAFLYRTPYRDPVDPFMLYSFKYPIPITDEHVQSWAGNDDTKWRMLLTDGKQ